ncbi:hypothetical protein ABZ093_34630 [Streptomyces cyaneofuscatus]|uniref:hypothetical protein n=1 Tax=Streptomyces cyaneofuscatus TaxID=66883 RepID=UPI0033B6E673
MTARLTRWAGLCAAVPLALALTGCGGGDDDPKPVFPTLKASSPAPSVDPDAAEKAAVLKAYDGMSAAELETYATGKLSPDLETYAAHKALADIKATVFWYQQQGTVMRGEPVRSPTAEIDTASDPLEATITDCVDSSAYQKVKKDSGKAAATPSGPRRHVVISTAKQAKTGTWKIYTSTIERDRTC